jgi:GxxExxY protein
MTENELSQKIIGLAIKVHRKLGPGLFESTYEECLCHELEKAGLKVERQRPLPLIYDGDILECGYRTDLIVENMIVVEIKAVAGLDPVHFAQILTYLKLSDCKLGLLINFNVILLKHGIKRVVNHL